MPPVSQPGEEIPTAHRGHEPLDQEMDYLVSHVEGKLPEGLRGTVFRNGPGRMRIGQQQFGHWFDGDGMVCKFTFDEGKVRFQNRYVRTPKYLRETSLGRIDCRSFGTQRPGGILGNALRAPANPANTNTIYHAGMLLALNEGGRPFRLSPDDLTTVGEYNYDGALGAADVFSAHGKVVPLSDRYINFGAGIHFSLSGVGYGLNLYRINRKGVMEGRGRIPLEVFPFCHDCAITEKFGVFFINSIVVDGMADVLLGRSTIADNIGYQSDMPMRVVVVDLDTLEEVKRFESAPGAIIHFGNAWQEGEELVVDGMYTDNFEANEMLKDVFSGQFGGGEYRRYRLNLKSGNMSWTVLTEVESEFPTFDTRSVGKQQRYTFTACSIRNGHSSFYNAIQSVTGEDDAQLVILPPGYYGSEPLFAPSADSEKESEGFVLELVYNAFEHRNELLVLSASDLTTEYCRILLEHHIPHQFHGHFNRTVF